MTDSSAEPSGTTEQIAREHDDLPAEVAAGALEQPEAQPQPPQATQVPPPAAFAAATSIAARESAVNAYCRELCGIAAARIATEEVIASPRLSGPFTAVAEQELLRITRSTASGFAPLLIDPSIPRMPLEGSEAACAFTFPRLARRANDELDRYSQTALAEHLARCVVCRAGEARFERAERAFAAVLGIVASAVEPGPIAPEPPMPEAEAEPEVAPPEAEPEPEPEAAPPPEPEAVEPEAVEPEPVEAVEPEPVEAVEPEPVEAVEPEPVEPLEPEPVEADVPAPIEADRPMRGLVVLPAATATTDAVASPPPVTEAPTRRSAGRIKVLIGTLLFGAIVVVIIALLWSSGSGSPDPHSLPPAAASPSSAVPGTDAHRASPAARRSAARGVAAGHAAVHHTAVAASQSSSATTTSSSAPTSSASSQTVSVSPQTTSASTPAASSPASSPAQSGSQTAGAGGSNGGPVATQAGGGNLPAAKAPTKTIGSMFQ